MCIQGVPRNLTRRTPFSLECNKCQKGCLALLTNSNNTVKISGNMARTPTSKLTVSHERILRTIANLGTNGFPVSLPGIVEELGLAGSSSLTDTLAIMQRNGFIEITGGGGRGKRRIIMLTSRGKAALGMDGLRVLGSIPAGPLKDVLALCETIVEEQELLPHQPGDFLLVVQGDSMVGDGILPGDKVLLRPDVQVQQGEIAAVHVDNEGSATLKHVYAFPERRQIVLKASNPAYEDIILAEQSVKVAGVYRGLVRSTCI